MKIDFFFYIDIEVNIYNLTRCIHIPKMRKKLPLCELILEVKDRQVGY